MTSHFLLCVLEFEPLSVFNMAAWWETFSYDGQDGWMDGWSSCVSFWLSTSCLCLYPTFYLSTPLCFPLTLCQFICFHSPCQPCCFSDLALPHVFPLCCCLWSQIWIFPKLASSVFLLSASLLYEITDSLSKLAFCFINCLPWWFCIWVLFCKTSQDFFQLSASSPSIALKYIF